jgi:hypothetical protein
MAAGRRTLLARDGKIKVRFRQHAGRIGPAASINWRQWQ